MNDFSGHLETMGYLTLKILIAWKTNFKHKAESGKSQCFLLAVIFLLETKQNK